MKEKLNYTEKVKVRKKQVRYRHVGTVEIITNKISDSISDSSIILDVTFITWNSGLEVVIDKIIEQNSEGYNLKHILKSKVIKDILASISDGRMYIKGSKVDKVMKAVITEEVFY